jgi:hypothetical protein
VAPSSAHTSFGTVLADFLPLLLLVGFFVWTIRRSYDGRDERNGRPTQPPSG